MTPKRWVLIDDWPRLAGAEVEVCLSGHSVRVGVVDDVTPDGMVLWLAQDGAHERTLVHRADGYQIRISPTQLQAPAENERQL